MGNIELREMGRYLNESYVLARQHREATVRPEDSFRDAMVVTFSTPAEVALQHVIDMADEELNGWNL